MFQRRLCRHDQAKHIQVELLVEKLFGDFSQRRKFVNAGVVDQDIEFAEGLLRLVKQFFNVRFLCDVGLQGNGFAAFAGDFSDDPVGAFFTRRIIHRHRRAFRGKMFGDGRANPFRCSGDNRDFACKFL